MGKHTGSSTPKDAEGPYSNLGPPPYVRFISRDKYIDRIIGKIESDRTTLVVVKGHPGVGKTSIVYEIAASCLPKGQEESRRFEAVVWIKGSEEVSFADVLDEVVETLGKGGLRSLEPSKKEREVDRLLRGRSTLVVVDSVELLLDRGEVCRWLGQLPAPSQAVAVTSRMGKWKGGAPSEVEIGPMDEREADEFIEARIDQLEIRDLVKGARDLDPLRATVDGNVKMLEQCLVVIKARRRTLPQLVDDLENAKKPFDVLHERTWEALDPEARKLLATMYFFPHGAREEWLKKVSGIEASDIDSALEVLIDLGVVESNQPRLSEPPLYFTDAIMRASSKSMLASQPLLQSALEAAWSGFATGVSGEVGFCWDDISRLTVLDDDSLRRNLEFAVQEEFDRCRYDDAIAIAKGIRYYLYVRGYWSSNTNLVWADAAEAKGDIEGQFEALTYHVNVAAKQKNTTEVRRHLSKLRQLADDAQRTPINMISYRHAMALYDLARKKLTDAKETWEGNLKCIDREAFPHEFNANSRWLATCLVELGREEEARAILEDALDHAQHVGFTRGMADIRLRLASSYIREREHSLAEGQLTELASILASVRDRRYDSLYSLLMGHVENSKGHPEQALKLYRDAERGFDELGLLEDRDESRRSMDELKGGEIASKN